MKIILELDDEERELLLGELESHQDEGPTGAGWKSMKFEKLVEKIRISIQGK